MKDFLGREYGPGDLVIYGAMSGRCVNMIIGRVVEVIDLYDSQDTYKLERLPEGELPPFKKAYGWFDAEGNPQPERGEGFKWQAYETDERVKVVTKVRIQPLRGARWTQHHDKTYWVDTRTGKRIDPTRSKKHVEVPSHYEYADGTHFDYAAKAAIFNEHAASRRPGMYRDHGRYEWLFREQYRVYYSQPGVREVGVLPEWHERESDKEKAKVPLWHVPDKYFDYVEEHKEGPKPVLIEVTDNIVKWEGELPPEEEPAPIE